MIVDELRLVGSPQTNKVMHAEFVRVTKRALGRRPPEPRKEGTAQLIYPFDAEFAKVAVAYMRTPSRVVRDLYRSSANRLEPLYEEICHDVAADDRGWSIGARTLSVSVRRLESFAAGERQLVGTVKNAIVDGCTSRAQQLRIDPENPDLHIVARGAEAGSVVVCLDLGAGSLSQRGWRSSQGAAPLREHLAAVLLMLSRFDSRREILVDPMCGSGTIPIEALMLARAEPRPLSSIVQALADKRCDEPLFADSKPLVIGQDVDLDALVNAKSNAIEAGVGSEIVWGRGDARMLEPAGIAAIAADRGYAPDATGVILSNPPYGERLDDPNIEELYAELGRMCRKFRGWRAGFLVGHPGFEYAFGREPSIKKPLANGNLRTYFYGYQF